MKRQGRILIALALFGLSVGMAGAIWKAWDYRDRLHAITDNARWEEHLRESGAYERRRIVFFGDSQIANWPMAESFGVMPILNRGQWGDWASKAVSRFERDVIAQHPDTVVILIGTNDLGNHQSLESIIASIDKMVQTAGENHIRVVICSLLPVDGEYRQNHPIDGLKLVNARLLELARERDAQYLDLFSVLVEADGTISDNLTVDGLHANSQGYARMTMAVMPALAD